MGVEGAGWGGLCLRFLRRVPSQKLPAAGLAAEGRGCGGRQGLAYHLSPALSPSPANPSREENKLSPRRSLGAGGGARPRAVMGHSGQGVGVGGKVLTAHLLLEPVLEHSHTGVDPRLPWLPASVPPGGDPVQNLLGAGAGLRTGQGASRVTLQGPRERGKREVTGWTHLIAAAPPPPPQ